ncbi:TPA: HNH endonuclease [Vibrio parahaemolyticus]
MKKLCSYPSCKNISSDGSHRCSIHKYFQKRKEVVKERAKFYSTSQWKKLSKSIRQQRPVCESCSKELTSDLDHWLEISVDPEHRYALDPSNLVCLCKSCHLKKGKYFRYLINSRDANRIYQWALAHHPRQDETQYLHEWIKDVSYTKSSLGELQESTKVEIPRRKAKAYSEEDI